MHTSLRKVLYRFVNNALNSNQKADIYNASFSELFVINIYFLVRTATIIKRLVKLYVTRLVLLFGLVLVGMTSAVLAEEPYDYYHASSCFNYHTSSDNPDTDADDPDAAFGWLYTDPNGKSVTNGTNNYFGILVCPIPRIYPRHPGRLKRVMISLSDYNYAAWDSFVRVVAVCVKESDNDNEPVCVNKRVPAIQGSQEIEFTVSDLAPTINVPWSWKYYMYITVDQLPGDKLYGYRTDFNLQ